LLIKQVKLKYYIIYHIKSYHTFEKFPSFQSSSFSPTYSISFAKTVDKFDES